MPAGSRSTPRAPTGAILIEENWDDSEQTDVVGLLRQLVPRGVRCHGREGRNGDAHLKAGLVGPGISRMHWGWAGQNIMSGVVHPADPFFL